MTKSLKLISLGAGTFLQKFFWAVIKFCFFFVKHFSDLIALHKHNVKVSIPLSKAKRIRQLNRKLKNIRCATMIISTTQGYIHIDHLNNKSTSLKAPQLQQPGCPNTHRSRRRFYSGLAACGTPEHFHL